MKITVGDVAENTKYRFKDNLEEDPLSLTFSLYNTCRSGTGNTRTYFAPSPKYHWEYIFLFRIPAVGVQKQYPTRQHTVSLDWWFPDNML